MKMKLSALLLITAIVLQLTACSTKVKDTANEAAESTAISTADTAASSVTDVSSSEGTSSKSESSAVESSKPIASSTSETVSSKSMKNTSSAKTASKSASSAAAASKKSESKASSKAASKADSSKSTVSYVITTKPTETKRSDNTSTQLASEKQNSNSADSKRLESKTESKQESSQQAVTIASENEPVYQQEQSSSYIIVESKPVGDWTETEDGNYEFEGEIIINPIVITDEPNPDSPYARPYDIEGIRADMIAYAESLGFEFNGEINLDNAGWSFPVNTREWGNSEILQNRLKEEIDMLASEGRFKGHEPSDYYINIITEEDPLAKGEYKIYVPYG